MISRLIGLAVTDAGETGRVLLTGGVGHGGDQQETGLAAVLLAADELVGQAEIELGASFGTRLLVRASR